ncbi:hypothetical protein RER_11010 [Rhodococcus erythropolis PR4]|uniref:Uncharacterized protein n=2 Tax=Rhodococcus erythropolis TaxID=1833 RepID=C0ZRQ9_RHOE4|nr:hypothetical protein RER_11010 [Rhodococcus erythropolis PR4]
MAPVPTCRNGCQPHEMGANSQRIHRSTRYRRKRISHLTKDIHMLTNAINAFLALWGSASVGSSGYQIPPGTLPFGS